MLPLLALPVSGDAKHSDPLKDAKLMEFARKQYTVKWAKESIKQDYYLAGLLEDEDWALKIRKVLVYFSSILKVEKVDSYDPDDDEDWMDDLAEELEYVDKTGSLLSRYVMALRSAESVAQLAFLTEDANRVYHMSNEEIVKNYEQNAEPRKKAKKM